MSRTRSWGARSRTTLFRSALQLSRVETYHDREKGPQGRTLPAESGPPKADRGLNDPTYAYAVSTAYVVAKPPVSMVQLHSPMPPKLEAVQQRKWFVILLDR